MFARLVLAGLLLVIFQFNVVLIFLCGERAIFQSGTQFMHGQTADAPWQAERHIKCPQLRVHLHSTRAAPEQWNTTGTHRPRTSEESVCCRLKDGCAEEGGCNS